MKLNPFIVFVCSLFFALWNNRFDVNLHKELYRPALVGQSVEGRGIQQVVRSSIVTRAVAVERKN
jgi:hypothetical protein